MPIERNANWLETESSNVFYWQHSPLNNAKNTAILIIGPIGPEYMPCHRSIKLLADKIATVGFHCIRYDPIGMGNSSGDLNDSELWKSWIKTPTHFIEHLKKEYNANNVIVIGLRSGNFILSEIIKNNNIQTAVFWHPINKGSAFIRGIQLLDAVLYDDVKPLPNNGLEGGGYPFSEELQNDIKSINILKTDYSQLKNVLIIEEDSENNTSKLADLFLDYKIPTDIAYLNGLDDMIKQVTLSKIPHSNINTIFNWLSELNSNLLQNNVKTKPNSSSFSQSVYEETAIFINSRKCIFSILTTPKKNKHATVLLFVNTGAAHHAGPNRIHVETARQLAQHRLATLRIDLSNLGDSNNTYEQDPPSEYPQTASADIQVAINYLTNNLKYENIVLCGISAGAHNIYHAALQSSNRAIKKIILINPETFYWSPNQNAFSTDNTTSEVEQAYYQKQIYDYKKWLALLTNPIKIYNTSLFVAIQVYKKTISYFFKLLTYFNIHIMGKLEQDIVSLNKKNISISLIYSENDPGHKILLSQAGITINTLIKAKRYNSIEIKNADHTFSSVYSREQLYKTLSNTLKNDPTLT